MKTTREIFSSATDGEFAMREYSARCTAHRLSRFGIERSLSSASGEELAIISSHLSGNMRFVFEKAAIAKGVDP